ncbi:hypothetical protein CARUB_v10015008mg [Capsella rubella]|uniref:Uncharacterized protein n=1 Tax=Capsella rubella TaxID=81985 RepID=R0G8D7_9BRAS|nr:hypothetical protein CARUB_v10015008mg [Capsella rubella]
MALTQDYVVVYPDHLALKPCYLILEMPRTYMVSYIHVGLNLKFGPFGMSELVFSKGLWFCPRWIFSIFHMIRFVGGTLFDRIVKFLDE